MFPETFLDDCLCFPSTENYTEDLYAIQNCQNISTVQLSALPHARNHDDVYRPCSTLPVRAAKQCLGASTCDVNHRVPHQPQWATSCDRSSATRAEYPRSTISDETRAARVSYTAAVG